jgi:hypothetical protein
MGLRPFGLCFKEEETPGKLKQRRTVQKITAEEPIPCDYGSLQAPDYKTTRREDIPRVVGAGSGFRLT